MFQSKNLFFATAGVTTLFIITILAMVAMLVGDPIAPANLWFNDHGATVLIVEVVLIGLLGMSAMIADRRETLRELREKSSKTSAKPTTDDEMKNPPKP